LSDAAERRCTEKLKERKVDADVGYILKSVTIMHAVVAQLVVA
jgi:hypothetical protein